MAVSMGAVIALIKALGGVEPSAITSAVNDWLDDHPEATTTVQDGSITYAKLATALAALLDGKYDEPSGGIPATDMTPSVQALLTAIGDIITATNRDIGKALSPKAVSDGKVTEWKFVSASGGGAVDDVQINGVSLVDDGVAVIESDDLDFKTAVSGTTPTINAVSGMRYICGEVVTLDIVVPSAGIIDVIFESGTTPTVLTVTPPTGVTIKWANGFDPTALEANTTYEINVMDGEYGVVGEWN